MNQEGSRPNHLVEVPTLALQPGMYIAELDRPWLETPFAMQGFAVQDMDDIEYVAKHCEKVYVDPSRNTKGLPTLGVSTESADPVAIKSEFKQAKADFETSTQAVEKVFDQIRSGKVLNVSAMQQAINPLIDSVFRNRDAMAALVRMKDKGDYLYNHAVACAVWCAVLGRHLGLDKRELQELALGASMMDVGMTRIRDTTLDKPSELSGAELGQIRSHVRLSLTLIKEAGGANLPIMNMIACHHERFDGSGYPQGLKGNRIPKFARIAALVDSYDAMLTTRPYSPARSSFDAIQELVDLKGVAHQGALVEQFVQTVGMFPTGSIVELNTGEVGIVVAQNAQRRLRPQLVLVLDTHKQPMNPLVPLDLDDPAIFEQGVPVKWISEELNAGAHGIQADEYFL